MVVVVLQNLTILLSCPLQFFTKPITFRFCERTASFDLLATDSFLVQILLPDVDRLIEAGFTGWALLPHGLDVVCHAPIVCFFLERFLLPLLCYCFRRFQ